MRHLHYIVLVSGLLALYSCSTTYADQCGEIDPNGVIRVEFMSATDDNCREFVKMHEHLDKTIMEAFIGHLNAAEVDPKRWKGSCWDQIRIVRKDTVLTFSYNTQVFGDATSGVFFRFPKE